MKNSKAKRIFAEIVGGDRRALGQAITLIESSNRKDQELADELVSLALQKPTQAIRVGITGSPGAGKSSLIEALGMACVRAGEKVAVLAIDPSSPIIGGSILGDKTRMVNLSASPDAFIRPSPSGKSSGGVLGNTRNSILLCEAAGFDWVFVETVGAGQSEYAVASMVDLVVFVHLPNSGDELQAVKRGVLELSDIILVSKADGDTLQGAQLAKADLERALSLSLSHEHRSKEILLVSSRSGEGISSLRDKIKEAAHILKSNGGLKKKRQRQLIESVEQEMVQQFRELLQNKTNRKNLQSASKNIGKAGLTPRQVASKMLKKIKR